VARMRQIIKIAGLVPVLLIDTAGDVEWWSVP
jgi:hypothetical protein